MAARAPRPSRARSGTEAQADPAVAKSRDALVQIRTKLINQARGLVKSFGERLTSCTAESFHRKAGAQLATKAMAVADHLGTGRAIAREAGPGGPHRGPAARARASQRGSRTVCAARSRSSPTLSFPAQESFDVRRRDPDRVR
jgi:hypothetical protein